MLFLELILGLAALVVAVVVLCGIGCMVAAILLDERSESFLSDPAARRSLLRL